MIETNNFYRIKELNILIQTCEFELKEMLKNGRSKKDFNSTRKQLAILELELAELNMSDFV